MGSEMTVAAPRRRVRMEVLLTILLMLFAVAAISLAANPAAAEQIPGKPLCGGTVNGKLQEPCGREPAEYIGKARGECPRGSFFDVGTWTCFKCPSGYQRTANNVEEWDACSKDVPDQVLRAKYEGRASCPPGAFIDPRNGGECWSCPSGFGRTMAAVDAWDACGAVFRDARRATFRGKACDTGFYDPRKGGECWSCPAGSLRTGAAVDQHNACIREVDLKPAERIAPLTCQEGDHFDFIDGGTCWRCPDNYARTVFNVKTNDACETLTLQWQPPARKSLPGLFNLPGAEQIAIEIVTQSREDLIEAARTAARTLRTSEAEISAIETKLLETDPAKSGFLSMAILTRAINALERPASQRSKAENDLIGAIEANIRSNRIFTADQARQMYLNWVKTRELQIARDSQTRDGRLRLTSTTNRKGVPPDVHTMVSRTIRGAAAPMANIGIAIVSMSSARNVIPTFKLWSPHIQRTVWQAGQLVTKSSLTSAGGSVGAVAAATAGPLVVLTAAAITAQLAIEEIAESERIRITTEDNLRHAKQPINLKVFLEQEGAIDELLYHWGVMTGPHTRPSPNYFNALRAAKQEPQGQTAQAAALKPVETGSPQVGTPGGGLTQHVGPVASQVQRSNLFRIQATHAKDLCFSADGGKPVKGRHVKIIRCDRAEAFRFQRGPDNSLRVNGLCLDVAGARPQRGAQLILWDCNGQRNQGFVFEKGHLVSHVTANRCLDAAGGRLTSGTKIITWDCHGRANQKWSMLPN